MAEENQNIGSNVPPLKTPEELRDEELKQYWLDPRIDYPEPYFMLEYNGTPFSTIGGIQAISGQKKNGKTFVLTMFMAAILGRESTRVHDFLPGLTVPERTIDLLGREPRVLFIDTEMEKLSSAKVLRRVHWLCEWDMKSPNDRFHVQWLRAVRRDDTMEAHEKRYRLIKMAIDSVEPDFVIIDGIRDLLSSINDEEQATSIISELSALAEERQICIWNALHQNPRPGNDIESKMRGWTGTELGNKVSDTFLSIKKKQGSDVVFTVKQDDARNKDVDDFQYIVTDAAGSLGIPRIIASNNAPSLQQTINRINSDEETMVHETIRVLRTIITPPETEYFTSLLKKLKEGLHIGEKKAKEYFNKVRDKHPNLLYQTNDGRFTMNKRELEAYDQGLPFAGPD